MLKKIKMVMMMMLVLGMTMLMSSAGCDNVAGGSGSSGNSGSSGSGGSGRVQTLESPNGSTITFTYDDPKEISTGSFTVKLVDADKDESFTFSTVSGTYTFFKDETGKHLGDFSFLVESPSDIEIDCNGWSFYTENDVIVISSMKLEFPNYKRVEFRTAWLDLSTV